VLARTSAVNPAIAGAQQHPGRAKNRAEPDRRSQDAKPLRTSAENVVGKTRNSSTKAARAGLSSR